MLLLTTTLLVALTGEYQCEYSFSINSASYTLVINQKNLEGFQFLEHRADNSLAVTNYPYTSRIIVLDRELRQQINLYVPFYNVSNIYNIKESNPMYKSAG